MRDSDFATWSTTVEVIEQFNSAVLEFRTTQSLLGRYSDINPSRVSRGLTEEQPFTTEEKHAIEQTITAMRELQTTIPHSLPLDWSQFGRIKPLIEQLKDQLKDQSDPMLPRYCVIKINGNYFSRIVSSEVVTRPDPQSCSCFQTPGLASEVVRKLLALGQRASVEIVPLMRRRSEMVRSLSQIGFTETETDHANN